MVYFVTFVAVSLLIWLYFEVRKVRSMDNRYSEGDPLRVKIEAFTGYGLPGAFQVAGRVSKDGGVLSALEHEFELAGFATKLRRNLRRFLLPELEGVALEVRIGSTTREVVTKSQGKFKVKFIGDPVLSPGNMTYSVRLHEDEKRFIADKALGQIMIMREDTRVGIISDVDDTIVFSNTHTHLHMILHAALTNVSDLRPRPGASALMRGLVMGLNERESNPAFYISGSPSNLHYKLHAFLRANRFPMGPFILTTFGRDPEAGFFQQRIFKTERIREILTQFPKINFVLIGDNGRWDPDIYQQIAFDFPGRILATLIYEFVPRIKMGRILPFGQHQVSNAMDAGLILYRKGLISRSSLKEISENLISENVLPRSFKIERALKEREEADRRFIRPSRF